MTSGEDNIKVVQDSIMFSWFISDLSDYVSSVTFLLNNRGGKPLMISIFRNRRGSSFTPLSKHIHLVLEDKEWIKFPFLPGITDINGCIIAFWILISLKSPQEQEPIFPIGIWRRNVLFSDENIICTLHPILLRLSTSN